MVIERADPIFKLVPPIFLIICARFDGFRDRLETVCDFHRSEEIGHHLENSAKSESANFVKKMRPRGTRSHMGCESYEEAEAVRVA